MNPILFAIIGMGAEFALAAIIIGLAEIVGRASGRP